MSRKYRNAAVRISQINVIKIDNLKLGYKIGDTVCYSLDDIKKKLDDWTKTKDIKYFIIEHNEDKENIHYHIVIMFPENSSCDFKTLKNKFPYGHISGCGNSVKGKVQYLIHMNDPEKAQYSWDDVITNAPDKLELFKKPNGTTSDKEKLQVILDEIIKGNIKAYEIDKIDYNLYIKYNRKIQTAFDYVQNLKIIDPKRDIQVFVCQGPSRSGKSTFCKQYAEKTNKSICFSSSSNDPWQDYKGQDIFVYDDFNHKCTKIEDLMKALDPHNSTSASARYRNKLFVGDTIIICTNIPILDWYEFHTPVHRRALFKRISCVLDFEECINGITEYTVNDIVVNDYFEYDEVYRTEHYVNSTLKCRDEKPHTFDLNKYVDYNADKNKVDELSKIFNEI